MTTIVHSVLLGLMGPQEIIIVIVFAGLSLVPLIFYLLTLQNTLELINPANRRMSPGQVWISLIPVVGLIWQIVVVVQLADSLAAELTSRNMELREARPGIGIGLAYCVLFCLSFIPFVGIVTALAGLVCWIIYWVKINEYKIQLRQG